VSRLGVLRAFLRDIGERRQSVVVCKQTLQAKSQSSFYCIIHKVRISLHVLDTPVFVRDSNAKEMRRKDRLLIRIFCNSLFLSLEQVKPKK
jgi:hypothetical protein